jgi:excisionase family DNA binding protein
MGRSKNEKENNLHPSPLGFRPDGFPVPPSPHHPNSFKTDRSKSMKEIMTPREAADYLSVHVRTIYRLAKNGEIPGRKVGGSWRFKKDALDEWLSWRENPSSKEKG